MVAGENSTEELKRQHQALRTASVKSRMESADSTLPSDLLRSVNQSRDKDASSWRTAVPLVDLGLVQFRDSLRLTCPVMQKGRVRDAETRWCSQPT